MMRGRFITLEGGEGTGKSTLISALSQALGKRGIECVESREPGGTELAEKVRDLALFPPDGHAWTPLAQALLMNASREDHLSKLIRPALNDGIWVLCDRFADSTRAYQSIDGVSAEVLMRFEDAIVGETRPDVTFILDASPDDLLERRQDRGAADMFEAKDMVFHEKVRQAFLDIAKSEPQRCVVLNALETPQNILAAALSTLENRFEIS